jgi:Leucine-rich repeat (LRR) protein
MVHGSSYGAGAAAKAEPAVPPEQELRRTPEQKAMSPERLNLDNTQLTACPRLLGEERVRLLNYQSNHIREISNMGGLPNLIFLDLYNNRISRISGLEAVSGLRVLMLGKNRLRVIESLDALSRIDVLDLHSNQVCRQLPAPSLGCDDGWAAPTKTAVLLTKVKGWCVPCADRADPGSGPPQGAAGPQPRRQHHHEAGASARPGLAHGAQPQAEQAERGGGGTAPRW